MIFFPRLRPIIGLTIFLGILLGLGWFGGASATEDRGIQFTPQFVRRLDTVSTLEPTAAFIPQPTVSPRLLPTLSQPEIEALTALCVVEAMNMEEVRMAACASILSTVLERTEQEILSDGTILGTLRWGCRRESTWCQFPAYVTYGCQGILPSRCPWNYPDQMDFFRAIIEEIADGLSIPDGCYGYLFYDSMPGDDRDCLIQSHRGVWIEFSN